MKIRNVVVGVLDNKYLSVLSIGLSVIISSFQKKEINIKSDISDKMYQLSIAKEIKSVKQVYQGYV